MVTLTIAMSHPPHNRTHSLDPFFLSDPNSSFGLLVNPTLIESDLKALTTLRVQCFCTVTSKNGSPVQWPDYAAQSLYDNRERYIPEGLRDRLFILWEQGRLVYFYKQVRVVPRLGGRKGEGDIGGVVERNVRAVIRDIKEEVLNKVLKNKVIQYLNYMSSLYGMPGTKNPLKPTQKNLTQNHLNFHKDLSTILNPQNPIHLHITANGITATPTPVDRNERQADLVLIQRLKRELMDVEERIVRGKGKGRGGETAGNLFVIKGVVREEISTLEVVGGVAIVQRRKINQLKYIGQNQPQAAGQSSIRTLNNVYLAKKIIKPSGHNYQNLQKRFHRELDIIRHITSSPSSPSSSPSSTPCHKPYLLNYYHSPQTPNTYYLDWHEHSLVSYLDKYRKTISLQQLLYLALQIVMIVMDLHSCGVVHRDLKPSNFVVDCTGGGRYPGLRVIDFSDAMVIGEGSRDEVISGGLKVYSTPAYCPLETSTFSQLYQSHGLTNKQIDYWSTGILLYQLLHGYLPVSYSTSTTKDIHALWKYQFSNHLGLDLRKRLGVGDVFGLFGMLVGEMVRIRQEERMGLEGVLAVLGRVWGYLGEVRGG